MKRKLDFKSVRVQIWLYLMLFSVGILVMLWLMQIVFIRVFYQGMKTSSIADKARSVARIVSQLQVQNLKTDTNVQSRLDTIVNENDMFISIIDTDGNILYDRNPFGRDFRTPVENMGIPPVKPAGQDPNANPDPPGAQGGTQNGANGTGTAGTGSTGNSGNTNNPQTIFSDFSKQVLAQPSGEIMQTWDASKGNNMLLYGKAVTGSDGTKAVLIVSSSLQPLSDTVRILTQQLEIISLVILGVAIGLSVLIALSISKPLMRITEKAKLLARGRYDMQFDRGGYSEVNQLADTLNYATGALMQVEKLRNELIANVSHDLRTPLTMIKIYAEMIRDLNGENRKKRDQNVAVIIEESDRLTALVQNLLDLSKMQSGTMPFQPTVFDLTGLIRRILPRYDALVQREGYRFVFEHEEPVMVSADEARIEQVLYNLINNAVNYTGEDKTVRLSITQAAGAARVSVTDTGEGIAPENLSLIWDRYYKVDKQHKRAVTGNGLGLSIVRSILDLHGTKFGVDSELGKGSTFWFELNKA